MRRTTIKQIVRIAGNAEKSDGKVRITYTTARGQERTVVRNIYHYTTENRFIVNFNGVQYSMLFDNNNIARDARIRGTDTVVIADKEAKASIVDKVKANTTVSGKTVVTTTSGEVKHMKYSHIKTCVENNIPVYLYGPAGSGKNHVLQQIADELGLDFHFTNSVQQEYKITGFIDAGGKYHETEFYKAFTNGGLFFLDEIDASIPEVLVLLNAAIANGYFEFPVGKVDAHPDFRVVSAGNTVGTGADEQYSGRLQLDQATLDRFAMIEFDYDRNIELSIAKGNQELVSFIRDLREQANEKGINATFSYRSISMVVKLEGKLQLSEIIRMVVVKGLDNDTINTLTTTPNNKYSKALWMLKQAG